MSDISLKFEGEGKWKVEFYKQPDSGNRILLKGSLYRTGSDVPTEAISIYWCLTIPAYEKRMKEEKLMIEDFKKVADKVFVLIEKTISKEARDCILSIWITSKKGKIQLITDFGPDITDTCDKLE